MIFGHHFQFLDEVELQNNYVNYFTNRHFEAEYKTIEVVCQKDEEKLDLFSFMSPWFVLSNQNARYRSLQPLVKLDSTSSWGLEIENVMMLIWDVKEKKILYIPFINYTPQRLEFWIFHTFFPIVLEVEKIYHILHVGSVLIEDKAVFFSAFSFGGKSTLTNYFIQKGHTMLSDDSVAIAHNQDYSYEVIASYPFHRPYREVETLGIFNKNFSLTPHPLACFYLLEKSDPHAKIEITHLHGIEKFKAFYYSNFINFSFLKKERFDFFTEMSQSVSMYKIKIPWDLERLDEVYEAIITHRAAPL